MMSAIGENIQACRKRCNLSREELAIKLRVGVNKIERYETGQQIPDTETILKLCTVLDVPASELLEQEFQTNPSGIDHEIEQLVKEIGTKKAKLILRKAKEFKEEDFLRAMEMLYDAKI